MPSPRTLAVALLALLVVLAGAPSATATAAPTAPAAEATATHEPRLHIDKATLRAALHCDGPFDSGRQPVLLVHGTFTHGQENYGWNYLPELAGRGFDVCYVDLPNRAIDDIQVSAEYVVHAIRRINQLTGLKVDILGHSQGGLEPRWALKYWPSLQAKVDDLVMLATPSHGTAWAALPTFSCGSCYQMSPLSRFLARLNRGDETPGSVSYTSIYSHTDEIVVPGASGALSGATNVSVQSVCLGRLVGHVGIVADRAVLHMVLDAFLNSGGTNRLRLPWNACLPPTFFPSSPQGFINTLLAEIHDPHIPSFSIIPGEPALKPYASF